MTLRLKKKGKRRATPLARPMSASRIPKTHAPNSVAQASTLKQKTVGEAKEKLEKMMRDMGKEEAEHRQNRDCMPQVGNTVQCCNYSTVYEGRRRSTWTRERMNRSEKCALHLPLRYRKAPATYLNYKKKRERCTIYLSYTPAHITHTPATNTHKRLERATLPGTPPSLMGGKKKGC